MKIPIETASIVREIGLHSPIGIEKGPFGSATAKIGSFFLALPVPFGRVPTSSRPRPVIGHFDTKERFHDQNHHDRIDPEIFSQGEDFESIDESEVCNNDEADEYNFYIEELRGITIEE
jgi:hypothetical protein